jgi:hypothetical protein
VKSYRNLDTMAVTGLVSKLIRDEKPAKKNIDVGGLGIGIYDRLVEQGHSRSLVNAVNFGGRPLRGRPFRRGRPAGRWAPPTAAPSCGAT